MMTTTLHGICATSSGVPGGPKSAERFGRLPTSGHWVPNGDGERFCSVSDGGTEQLGHNHAFIGCSIDMLSTLLLYTSIHPAGSGTRSRRQTDRSLRDLAAGEKTEVSNLPCRMASRDLRRALEAPVDPSITAYTTASLTTTTG